MMELHVFDFDGTLFSSPVPDQKRIFKLFRDKSLTGRLLSAPEDGGLGWFQRLESLSPPFVPAKPAIDKWYVLPVLNHLKKLIELEEAGGESSGTRLFFILTGRSECYRGRITELLDHAGVGNHFKYVFLKPYPTFGTVKHKMNVFSQLIHEYRPSTIFYYEDRPRQGAQLYLGVRTLQERLYPPSAAYIHSFCHVANAFLDENEGKGSSSSALKHIPVERLIGERDKKRALGTAERFVESYKKSCQEKGEERFVGNGFSFDFIMVMVEEALSIQGEHILDDDSLASLVTTLMAADEAAKL